MYVFLDGYGVIICVGKCIVIGEVSFFIMGNGILLWLDGYLVLFRKCFKYGVSCFNLRNVYVRIKEV